MFSLEKKVRSLISTMILPLSLLLLPSPSYAEETDFNNENVVAISKNDKINFGVGFTFGTRSIKEIEPSVEKYISSRNLDQYSSEVNDIINLEKTFLPYMGFTFNFYSPKDGIIFDKDSLEIIISTTFSSSKLFGEQSGDDNVSLEYQDIDFDDAEINWTDNLDFYGSLGFGTNYSPHHIKIKAVKLKPSFILDIGISYLKNTTELNIDLTENRYVQLIGKRNVEENLGISTSSDSKIVISGLGYYFHPSFKISLEVKNFELSGLVGYRVEDIPINIEEIYEDYAGTSTHEGRGELNANGLTFDLAVRYNF